MRESVLENKKDELVAREKAKTSVGTLQFGVYGTAQAFEFEVSDGHGATAIDTGAIMEAVHNLVAGSSDIRALQENRVQMSKDLVRRFEKSCQAWINLATSYVNTGLFNEAKVAVGKALEIDPSSGSAKAILGRILILEGNIRAALNVYEEIAKEKKNIAARETVAILKLALGEPDMAIEELQSAIEDNGKKSVSLHYNLGVAYLVKGRFDKAISNFRKATDISPKYYKAYESIGVAYILLGLNHKAEKMFKIASEINPRDPSAKLSLARILMRERKFVDAAEVLTGLVQEFPRLWIVREELGILKLRINKPKEAVSHFEKIAEAIKSKEYNGNLSNALNNIGVAKMCIGNLRSSEEVLEESLYISSGENVKAGINLVRLYITEHRLEKAKEMLTELMKKHGENLEVLNILANYYSLTGEYEESMNIAKKILTKDRLNLDGASMLSMTLADVYDNLAEAEAILRPLEVRYGKNSKFLNNLAYILLLQDKIVEGENLLNRIQEDDQIINSIPLATKGLLLLRKGDISEGTRLYSEAARLAGNQELADMIIQKRELELGKWYLKLGYNQQAQRHFEKVLEKKVQDKVFELKAEELEKQIY